MAPPWVRVRTWKEYWAYDRKNPDVFATLEDVALRLFSRTRPDRKFGFNFITVGARWERALASRDDEGFKITDAWHAFHARRFLALHPQHVGRFDLSMSMADHPLAGSMFQGWRW
jgi:hypothetical protein